MSSLVRGVVFNLAGKFYDLSNFSGLVILLKRINKLKFFSAGDM